MNLVRIEIPGAELAARGWHDDMHSYAIHQVLTEQLGHKGPWFAAQTPTGVAVDLYSDSIRGEPVPDEWPEGCAVGLRVRLCPVIRLARDEHGLRRGAEIDVYHLTEIRGQDPMAALRAWVVATLARAGVRITDFGIDATMAEMTRRTQAGGEGRTPRTVVRRVVDVAASVVVSDPVIFTVALARGVGRHKAFGFGMLRVVP